MGKGTKRLENIFIPTTDEINQGFTINAWHVSQSVNAFTGTGSYDIDVNGSLTVTGSIYHENAQDAAGALSNVVVRNNSTGEYFITGSFGSMTSGTSGSSGSSGTSGSPGDSGTSGSSGSSGTSGNGTSGSSGSSGTSGNGTSGSSGSSGTSGSSGAAGTSGSSGSSGTSGNGTSGSSGSSGTSGSSGNSGTSGSSGSSGTSGTGLTPVHSVSAGTLVSVKIITNTSTPSLDDINGGTLLVYGNNTQNAIRFGFSAAAYTKDFNCTIIYPGMASASSTSGDSGDKLEFSATPYDSSKTYTKVTTGAGSGGGYKFDAEYSAGDLTFTGYKDLEAGGILRVSYSYANSILTFHGIPLEL